MSDSEKIAALHLLLHSLAEDNSNRFIAEKIAVKLSILIEKNRYKKRMSDLQK